MNTFANELFVVEPDVIERALDIAIDNANLCLASVMQSFLAHAHRGDVFTKHEAEWIDLVIGATKECSSMPNKLRLSNAA